MDATDKKKKPKYSLNRKRVAKNIINQIKENKVVNQEKAVKEAGYSNSTARSRASDIVRSRQVQSELASFIEDLDKIIENSTKQLEKQYKKATYRDNVDAIDKLTKTKALLTGNATSNEALLIQWSDETDSSNKPKD